MTGTFVQGMAKYLGATRFGVSNRAFGATLLLGEEQGTRAAVGYRQAVKQLSGIEQTVERSKNLQKLGLIQGHMEGRRWVTTGVKDDAALKQNLPEYIAEEIAKGQGGERYSETDRDEKKRGRLIDKTSPLAKAETLFGRAFNLDFIEDVQALGVKLVGNSNALDTLTNYMFNWKEIQAKLDRADKSRPEDVEKALKDNPVLMAQQLQNQFQGVMGSAITALAPVLTPTMKLASDAMSELGTTINTAMGPKGPAADKAQMSLLTGAAVTAVTGMGLNAAGTLLGPALSTLATPVGYAVGLAGR